MKPTAKSGQWEISSESSLTPTIRPSVSRKRFQKYFPSFPISGGEIIVAQPESVVNSEGGGKTTSEQPAASDAIADLQIRA